jgi:hypothetical protein
MPKYIISASRVTLSTAFTFTLLTGLISAQESDTARAVTRTQTVAAAPVAAVSAVSSSTKMSRALNWAIRNAKGDRYVYGATGPNTWDCSGLVMTAYRKGAGIRLPRTTGGMLDSFRKRSSRFKRVNRSYAMSHRGTIAFHGNGHVELVSSSKYKYGARRSGTRVGFTSWYDLPGWKFYALR